MPVSLKLTSQAVAVVPTLAPSSTARLPEKDSAPALTSDTASDDTALLDCTSAVNTAPSRKPL